MYRHLDEQAPKKLKTTNTQNTLLPFFAKKHKIILKIRQFCVMITHKNLSVG